MSLIPLDTFNKHRRFSTHNQLATNLVIQFTKNLSIPSASMKKSSSLVTLLKSDRSLIKIKPDNKQRNNKEIHGSNGLKNNQLDELNKKLLNDIQMYRRQIKQLKAQNQLLMKYKKQDEIKIKRFKYNQIKITKKCNQDLEKTKLYENQQINIKQDSIKEYQSEKSQKNSFHNIHHVTNFDTRMIISKNISQQIYDRNMQLQVKIQSLQIINKHLEHQNLVLKNQLQNISLKTQSISSLKQKINTQQNSPEILCLKESNFKEKELQNKIYRLQNHIKQIQKRHSNLKDRCHTIKHLISGSN